MLVCHVRPSLIKLAQGYVSMNARIQLICCLMTCPKAPLLQRAVLYCIGGYTIAAFVMFQKHSAIRIWQGSMVIDGLLPLDILSIINVQMRG